MPGEIKRSVFASMFPQELALYGIEPKPKPEAFNDLKAGEPFYLDIASSSMAPGQKFGESFAK